MTNPNDAIGTNAAYGGRTSTNAFNDVMATLSRGVLSGWACVPNTGMTVSLGGDGNNRDVAIAEDNAGNKTSINNISESPVDVTMSAAPASNTRIDVIVAYVDNPATGNSSEADNPDACGLIAVNGTPSATPVAPNESAIRTAITADGASGTTAYYVILAYITIPSGTTDITNTNIQAGASSTISNIASNSIDTANLKDSSVTTNKVADGAITSQKIDFTTFSPTVIVNSYLSSLQSTTSTSGVNVKQTADGTDLGNIPLTLIKTSSVFVAATFPLSTSASNASVDLYIDDVLAKEILTNNETASHSTTGFLRINSLSAGSHKFTFKLRANTNQTAYIGSYRTISVAIMPIPN
jgi:hypothetical protein